jgi:glycogen debranching enzyme
VPNPAWARLPEFLHQLTATVRAPACALGANDGQIRAVGVDGVFVSDLRVLSEAHLRFGDADVQGLARMPAGPGCTRFVGVVRGFGDPISDPTVRVDRLRRMAPDGMTEDIRISSTATVAVAATASVAVRCDLLPLEQVRVGQVGAGLTAQIHGGRMVWHGGGVTVTASAAGGRAESGRLSWDVNLAPGESVTLTWSVLAGEKSPILVGAQGPVEWSRPRVDADDPRIGRLLAQSLDDLESLRLAESADPDSTFLGAGVPWFLTLFGRDSLWAARMMLPVGTGLAASTLLVLARRQGSKVDERSAEAPGKIMHELRHEDTRVGEPTEFATAYYGTVDATLLWISLLADAWRWGLTESTVASLLPHLHRALYWLQHHGDPDQDGFVEYIDRTGRGLANQGWKDSFNAIRFHNGHIARAPIALCEVQGYAHRAALDAAAILEAFGGGEPDRWRQYAADLATNFRNRYWTDGALGPYPAMALDADGRQVDSLTSNIGHLLGTGILSADEETVVARLLAGPALGSGYGLRTMSTIDGGFDPLSYHCGSVWPHDTAIALLGLSAGPSNAAATPIIEGLLQAAEAFEYRLPELYGGDARADVGQAVPYPGACRPQAWSAAAGITVVQALLGLTVDVPDGKVRLSPLRRGQTSQIDVRGLTIAGRRVDVSVDRNAMATITGLPSGLHVTDTHRVGAPLP